MNISNEFLTIAIIHLLAVASPGPDFAVTLKQSVSYGRRAGFLTSFGIGMGIFVHIAYCIVGLGVIISQSILLFNLVKLVGAAYLVIIGIAAIRTKPKQLSLEMEKSKDGSRGAFLLGFLTNVLNPKATLFFLSVFSVVVSPATAVLTQIGYGLWMAFATTLWFGTLTQLFRLPSIRNFLNHFGHWFDRVMGVLLVALGVRLAFAEGRS